MRKSVKKAAVVAVASVLVATTPLMSLQAATATSDFGALGGFSYKFEKYLDSQTEETTESEESTMLLSDGVEIPENVAVANVVESCNIREGAGTNYNIIGLFPKNAYCVVKSVTEDGWAQIESGDVKGYIKTDYLFMGEEGYQKACELAKLTATVTAGSVNVRTAPTTEEDNVIMEVNRGEELEVVAEAVLNKNDPQAQLWVKVVLDSSDVVEEDAYGYVTSQYVKVGYNWKTAVKIDPIDASVSAIRQKVVTEARKYLGLKYVWGGTSLKTGADCSGFCIAIYKACGINTKKLPRTSYNMAASANGKTVSLANAKPGDLVFYGDSAGNVNHVGIYLGNNKVIHERGRKYGCVITSVSYRKIIKIKNFIDYIY
ncbi:MAG: C40 family peptidase [Lachnospiraceae bacterium]|nr:C40 family peptidase [Lachnospiraceae bacterium]